MVLDDGWPILFSQERVGRSGRPFRIWKFRSMRTSLPGRSITAGDDPRVTRVVAHTRLMGHAAKASANARAFNKVCWT